MFSGIVEAVGTIKDIVSNGSNKQFTIESSFTPELYIDQSIAHNGVCLTVVSIGSSSYVVTAIHETLQRSNLGLLKIGDSVNLERSITSQTRLDGHNVQGHVDDVITCTQIINLDGSHKFVFEINPKNAALLVQKGSVTLNGVSLTVNNPTQNSFSVDIIPYTLAHTTFKSLEIGNSVNIEFDIIGKYVQRYMELTKK